MRNKIIRIIEREMEVTNNKTYQEYLRQLKRFLDKESKNFNNYEENIRNFKEFLIKKNNYCIGDLCTINWCNFMISHNKERIERGEEIKPFYTNPKEEIIKYQKILKKLKETNYKEENEKELQKYTDKIISRIKEKEEYDITNYELTKEKIESDLCGETKKLAYILLEYLEEEKEKILNEIRNNKK